LKIKNYRCGCSNVGMGTYANATVVTTPAGKTQYIDNCILPDLLTLWTAGVETIESCCGHGKECGYIAVRASSIVKMIGLGYMSIGTDDYGETRPEIFTWPKKNGGLK